MGRLDLGFLTWATLPGLFSCWVSGLTGCCAACEMVANGVAESKGWRTSSLFGWGGTSEERPVSGVNGGASANGSGEKKRYGSSGWFS